MNGRFLLCALVAMVVVSTVEEYRPDWFWPAAIAVSVIMGVVSSEWDTAIERKRKNDR